nr:MAG TPA: Mature oligodendrocyte transmembrane protein [Caudoviricetes sp.]
MQNFYNVMIIMYLILGIFLLINITTLIGCITNKTREEARSIELNRVKEELKPVSKELDYLDKLEATVGLLNFINVLIENEIDNKIISLSKLNSKYEMIKLDEDAKAIATNIFQSINNEQTFVDNNLIMNNEYIMKYITEQSIVKLLDKASQYNIRMTSM